MSTDIKSRVENAIALVRPYLQADGGDIELVGITGDKVVQVRLLGACKGCPYSVQTLKAGVEQAIMKEVPEVKEVVAVE